MSETYTDREIADALLIAAVKIWIRTNPDDSTFESLCHLLGDYGRDELIVYTAGLTDGQRAEAMTAFSAPFIHPGERWMALLTTANDLDLARAAANLAGQMNLPTFAEGWEL